MRLNLHFIKHYVESELGVTGIETRDRSPEYANARYIYCILAKKYTNHSLKDIGKLIDRDHSTVIHALRNPWKVTDDPVFGEVIRKFSDGYKHVIATTVIDEETTDLMSSLDKAMRENDAMRVELVQIALEKEGVKTFAEYLAELTRGFTDRQMYELKTRLGPQIKMIAQTRYR